MKLNYNGTMIDTEIIGGFKINQKEYCVCTYGDGNNNYKIIIMEIIRENNNFKVKEIPKEEIEIVYSKYKEIEETLGGV